MTARAKTRWSEPLPFDAESTNGFVARSLLTTLSTPCREMAFTLVQVSMAADISGVSASGLR
jgi:hypothetical protein